MVMVAVGLRAIAVLRMGLILLAVEVHVMVVLGRVVVLLGRVVVRRVLLLLLLLFVTATVVVVVVVIVAVHGFNLNASLSRGESLDRSCRLSSQSRERGQGVARYVGVGRRCCWK